jgi:hypothetical protein
VTLTQREAEPALTVDDLCRQPVMARPGERLSRLPASG